MYQIHTVLICDLWKNEVPSRFREFRGNQNIILTSFLISQVRKFDLPWITDENTGLLTPCLFLIQICIIIYSIVEHKFKDQSFYFFFSILNIVFVYFKFQLNTFLFFLKINRVIYFKMLGLLYIKHSSILKICVRILGVIEYISNS